MALIQWVNLGKEEIFAKDADVGSIDRCGKVTVEAVFKNGEVPLGYKVKVTEVGSDNAVYTEEEKNRNGRFKMTKGSSEVAVEKSVVMEDGIQLPAAGGNKYKIEAMDENDVSVSSVEIETRRKLYYQVIVMEDAVGRVASHSLGVMEAHSLKHFIKLQKTGSEGKMPYHKTLDMSSRSSLEYFGNDLIPHYNIDPLLKRKSFAAVFADYIASKSRYPYVLRHLIGAPSQYIDISSTEVTITGDKMLWYGLDDADDANKNWFISGSLRYAGSRTADQAVPPVESYKISRADVEIAGTNKKKYGGYHEIRIKRSAGLNALLSKAVGTLEFAFDFNIVSGWKVGFSWAPFPYFQIIVCAQRYLFRDASGNESEFTWSHELGHRFGMVAHGDRKNADGSSIPGRHKFPDAPSTYYSDSSDGKDYGGHRGPHCNKGATYDPAKNKWSGKPGCMMFGGIGVVNSDARGVVVKNAAPKEFCSECAPIVRKLDLST